MQLLHSMGTLYLVSTPIGNLADITLRALKVLKTVDVIFCEDTRHTGLLLKHYGIETKMLQFHEHNEALQLPKVVELLQMGKNIALVSDAGTPTISDPGFKLVRVCAALEIPVVAVPGASALLAALTVSGLPTDKFLFVGYLPKKPGKCKKLLQDLSSIIRIIKLTLIFYEAPHRLVVTLQNMRDAFGNKPLVICRELTKLHEEVLRTDLDLAIKHFQETEPRGEFTIVF